MGVEKQKKLICRLERHRKESGLVFGLFLHLRCFPAFRFEETQYILIINFLSCVLFLLKWVSIPVRQESELIQKWALAVCRIHLLLLMKKGPNKMNVC